MGNRNKYGLKKQVPNRTIRDENNLKSVPCVYKAEGKCYKKDCLHIDSCMHKIHAMENSININDRIDFHYENNRFGFE